MIELDLATLKMRALNKTATKEELEVLVEYYMQHSFNNTEEILRMEEQINESMRNTREMVMELRRWKEQQKQ